MQLDLQNGELCLAENAPVRLRCARGLTVCCTGGRVWLTVTGEPGDIILTPGDQHRIRSNGLALLEAIGTGQVRLEPTATPLQRLRTYIVNLGTDRLMNRNCPSGKALRSLCGDA